MRSDGGFHAPVGGVISASGYDQWIGRWSRLFVPSLLEAAEIRAGHRVLDVATGTGEAAAAAILRAGREGIVVGADISLVMLAAACARLPRCYRAVVTDGQALAFADASFDSIVCQLGLMFFPNPAKGLAEFRRVLRTGGRAAVCVISEREKAPMWGVLAEALSRQRPDQRAALNLSFSLADPERLKEMLVEAGFREVRVSRETRHGTYASFDDYWAAIETGAGQLPLIYLGLPEHKRQWVREEVRAGLARFETNGLLEMSVEMLIGVGRA